MKDIKISILVPAFNAEPYIGKCLQSLKCQTLQQIEIVVVDDGSTDRTREIARQYAVADNRFRVYSRPHQGISPTRNACMQLARGRYIGFVDSDDYVKSDAFEGLFTQAEKDSADIVFGSISYCYANGTTQRFNEKASQFPATEKGTEGKEYLKILMQTDDYEPMVCGNLYRLAFLQQHGIHFEATYHEDEYFSPYAFYFAKRVSRYEPEFYFYRQHAGSIMHSDNLTERSESLHFIREKLIAFIHTHIRRKEKEDIEEAYEKLAETLCFKSRDLYEHQLRTSSKKCLFVFSEESVAKRYGIGTYIDLLIKCFDQSQWDIQIITLHTTGPKIQWEIKNGVARYGIGMPLESPYTGATSYDTWYYKTVFYFLASKLATSRKVYCHFNFSAHHDLAVLFKERLQATIVFTLHYTEWSFDLLGDRKQLERMLARTAGKKEDTLITQFECEKRFMATCCDSVIAIARHSYAMLRELYEIPEHKLACIPNGLDDGYIERSPEACARLRKQYGFGINEKLLIFAGRLDAVKGIVELIEAFKKIVPEVPSAKLIVAGSGNLPRCFDAAAPMWSHIVFTGFLPKNRLFELYAIAHTGIVPSIHEEFGYVAAEMMMNNLPILVHNTTGLSEITDEGKYGTIFEYGPNNDTEGLAAALKEVLSKSREQLQAADGRKRIAENYSLATFADRITHLYS